MVKLQEELDIDVLVHGEPEVSKFILCYLQFGQFLLLRAKLPALSADF